MSTVIDIERKHAVKASKQARAEDLEPLARLIRYYILERNFHKNLSLKT
jgi:hypothetical protein